ncbi:hypothetical protein [Chitinophaga rhizophila]|uniref:Uncharacterized protein n=1 Tax=Chitinophaga rhizophila TaxID=2866212 RepID=A0ABS7G733_9BACT|nr:hypothetical protein [Chitinophaga rhizophila]MBW8683467.1 hypothetical protein [Chitinophaga rhizophila]
MKKKLSGKSSEDLSFLADSSAFTSAKSFLTNRLGSSSSYVDSLSGTLQFLNGQKQLLAKSGDIQKAIKSVNSLQDQMKHAQDVKDFIKKRKALLAQKLSGYTGASKYLGKYSKEVYYYGARLREYKTLLGDRKQLETKAIALLKKLPAYNDFLRRNSRIASLLNTLPGSGSIASLEGLQTRSMVAAMLQQRLGTGATGISALDDQLQRAESELIQQRTPGIGNIRQTVNQQMSSARNRMNQIREGSSGEDNAAEMPDFKPSPLKAKRLWQRLEFGGNIQFQKKTDYFPTTSDIAGQVAYRYHENGSAGIGIAYKLGLGTGWKDIRLSHSGIGIRSFVDWRIKNSFFLNGGAELNRLSAEKTDSNYVRWHGWQTSALLGVTKKYKVSGNIKGNIAILYDFLAPFQVPKTSGLKVRIGYSLQ